MHKLLYNCKCTTIAWVGAKEDTAGCGIREQCGEGDRWSSFQVTKENPRDMNCGTKESRG